MFEENLKMNDCERMDGDTGKLSDISDLFLFAMHHVRKYMPLYKHIVGMYLSMFLVT